MDHSTPLGIECKHNWHGYWQVLKWSGKVHVKMQRKSHTLSRVVQLLLTAVLVLAALNYQFFLDRYALATFRPAADMAAIEGRLGLTDSARALLYRAESRIDDKTTFNNDCETSKGELELGCFYRGHIYVLRIENPSLAPEMDVVTAHELLHAAWVRLSRDERSRLAAQLQQVYADLNDAELKQRMDGYAKSEPGQEANELHSILATEQPQLPAELEQYYNRYFTNRASIVAAHAAYEGVFDARRHELEVELATIRGLKGQLAVVNKQLDTHKAAGRIAEYNALVPRQNQLVDDINGRIERYRQGVDEYNALSRSLDSQEITETEPSVQ